MYMHHINYNKYHYHKLYIFKMNADQNMQSTRSWISTLFVGTRHLIEAADYVCTYNTYNYEACIIMI